MVKMEETQQVLDALRMKYNGGYAFLTQVGNATGFSCNRHADALAIGLWESRGLEIVGFEIKISRSDWIKELKNPGKADPIAKYCDSWYLVLGNENILRFGELPMGWGLIVPHTKNTLKVVKESERNLKPTPVDKPFLCAILRRASEQILPEAQLRREYNRGYDEGCRSEKESNKRTLEWKQKQINKLEKEKRDFENASGFSINEHWTESKIVGEAVRMVLNGTYLRERQHLEDLRRDARRIVKNISEELKKYEEIEQNLEIVNK